MPVNIIYADDDLIAINKPAGLLVHRSPLAPQERVFALQLLRDAIGAPVYPVHRLDRPTSGVLLFARHPASAAAMGKIWQSHAVEKTYLAIVRGWPAETGTIDYPLRYQMDKYGDRDKSSPTNAQAAQSDFQRLKTAHCPWTSGTRHPESRYSLLRLVPHQGRKHQLRRHLKHIGHPIIGDTTHGDLRQNHALQQQTGQCRLMLHAATLTFCHPRTGEICTIDAPCGDDWQAIAEKLQLG